MIQSCDILGQQWLQKNHDDLVISMMTLVMRTTATYSQYNMMVVKMMMLPMAVKEVMVMVIMVTFSQ